MRTVADDEKCGRPAKRFLELAEKFGPAVRRLAGWYAAPGLDRDDLAQEAYIGLLKAARVYDESAGVPFEAFAALCMKRQVQKAVSRALAKKRTPPESSAGTYNEESLSDYIESGRAPSPEEIVMSLEELEDVKGRITSLLSRFEQETLGLYLAGLSYSEIAEKLSTTEKSVDNALQRVRRKLRPHRPAKKT